MLENDPGDSMEENRGPRYEGMEQEEGAGAGGRRPRKRKLEESIKTRRKRPVLAGSSAGTIKNLFDDPSVPVASRSWKKRGWKRERKIDR